MRRLPIDFIVLGAQKAGSTSLAKRLAEHPRCWMPAGETPLFEDPFFSHERLRRTADQVASAKSKGLLVGLKRPDWLGRNEVPNRIAATCPDTTLICVLRDPIGRAISAYYWYLQTRLVPFAPLNEGMQRILDEWTGEGPPVSARSSEIISYSLYGSALRRYVSNFSAEQILVITEADYAGDLWRERFGERLGISLPEAKRAPRSNPGVFDYRRIRLLRIRSRLFPPARNRDGSVIGEQVTKAGSRVVTGMERSLIGRLGQVRPDDLDAGVASRLSMIFDEDSKILREVTVTASQGHS